MRFVSMYPGLGLGTFEKELFKPLETGELYKMRDSTSVTFSRDAVMQADIDFALSYWPEKRFTGRYQEEDRVTLEPLDLRIGVFDTAEHGWDDELRGKVEAWMLAKENYGTDFVQVEHVASAVEAGKPWPTYDDTHHFKIPTLAVELGLVDQAIAYEQANKNRDGVIAALEEKKGVPAGGEVIAA